MNLKKNVLLLLLVCYVFRSPAQQFNLTGKITSKKEVLPFATIIVKGTSISTNSNADGLYLLKLPAGNYEIVFQYVGCEKRSEKIQLSKDDVLDVDLRPDGVTLSEVDVTAGEDPAYPIMRQAIRMRKFYLEQVNSFSCKAYIKALQKINEMPKNIGSLIRLLGGNVSDTSDIKGVVYLSESESEYFFRRPDDVKEIMYSSKLSGDNRSFSFNKLSDLKFNLYKNLIEMGNLSNRPFISPLNENSFLFYRFFLLGHIESEGRTVYKIKVVPKNSTAACFRGIIYIQDASWRLTGADLMIPKETRINYVDTVYIRQLHAPVLLDSIWMPFSLNLTFTFKILGFKGGGYFNAIMSDYKLNPNFASDFFNNEVLVIQDGANKKDSSYWNSHRAVPLTVEEKVDYERKDSLRQIRETDRYRDSADRVSNRVKLPNLLLGYRYSRTRKNLTVDVPGLFNNGVHYNTVEGLNLSLRFTSEKVFDDFRQHNLKGSVRYGFSNKLWGGELSWNYLLDPKRRTTIGLTGKSIVEQYNRQEPINALVNSLYTLFMNRNYMKLFKETGGGAEYSTEIINGLTGGVALACMQRQDLINTTDVLFVDDPQILFSDNRPYASDQFPPAKISNSFTSELYFRIRFKQKYISQPEQKIITGSKYPRVIIRYRKAFAFQSTSPDYDFVSLSIADNVRFGLFGRTLYNLSGGGFITSKRLYFMDYQHFQGNQTIFNTNDLLSSFRLLPYYTYSSGKWFAQGHIEHHFQGVILGQLPLLKKIKAQEVVGLHVLSNNVLPLYYEVSMGLERIFKVIRIEYVFGFRPNSAMTQGLSCSLTLRF
jgi:hypothetical protein